ncbi:phage tail assembly protein [bacterium D16-50]|nr:phage tail assembly protein [bacterium D16-50]
MEGIDNIVLQETEDTKRAGGNPGDLATERSDNDEAGDSGAYVRFSKPYVFEDDTFGGIDMSCLEGISTRDMMEIEKRFYRLGITSMNPENTLAYAKLVIQKASGLPIEFFEGLPVKEMMKIKGRVVNFFYS